MHAARLGARFGGVRRGVVISVVVGMPDASDAPAPRNNIGWVVKERVIPRS